VCQALFKKENDEESAIINCENGLPTNPLFEVALKAIADWVSNYRNALLRAMLVALHVDPEVITDMDPLVTRELKWLCLTCNNKKRCEHELAKGTAPEHFREFCPNAVSLDELLFPSICRHSADEDNR
jgi:hypothetical protein